MIAMIQFGKQGTLVMRRLLIAAILLTTIATPALSQGAEVDRRIDRIEREVRAIQRRVFPGGSSEFFEADIQPSQTNPSAVGSPASAPITDLTDRVNALERQLATLTGQVEENSYSIRQLQASVEALRTPAEPLGEFETSGTARSPSAAPSLTDTDETAREEAKDEPEAVEAAAPSAAPIGPEGAEPPLPSDPGEAAYVRGYRLWRDGNYEGARRQLRSAVEGFPGHRFESYSRNLLGRAYLDDGKPANATEIFVRNYQELPNGERAADSLFFLGVALTELNYNDRACLAFDELMEVYGADLRSSIAEQVPSAREAANCR